METDIKADTKNKAKTVKKGYVRESFPVLEMTCAACAVSVESMLKSVDGVNDAGVNFATQDAWVEYNPELAPPEKLQDTIRSIGYDLVIEKHNQEELKEEARINHYQQIKRRTIGASLFSIPGLILGMFFMKMPFVNWIMMVLTAPVVFYFGRNFFVNAWKQLKHKKANMDTLVALSTGIAWFFSLFNTIYPQFWEQRGLEAHVYYEAAAMVVTFILFGKLLEEKAKAGTSAALKKLMGLQPKTVGIVLEDDEIREIPIAEVRTNYIIQVKPGERIPVDGEVTSGSSYVDESMITGEPVAVLKTQGGKVYAGTINQKGSFRFRAEKVGAETILAQIIKMVKDAQGSKAPVQKFVDKVAAVFVPVVIGIAIITFISWLVLGGDNAFTYGLLTAVTVLVIACPCALGLATPTAIMVGVGKGAENNILIRDAESLELGHRTDVVILDKTGTITEGRPAVEEIIFTDNVNPQQLKQVLLAMEKLSEHPLAEAVVRHLTDEGIKPVAVNDFESITGKGVAASMNGQRFYAGNRALLEQYGIQIPHPLEEKAHMLRDNARTVVFFAAESRVTGIISIADKIKQSSAEAIRQLRNSGIEVYMLTGDNQETAAAIAREAGISHFKAEVLPAGKAAFVKELQQGGKVVAMVGDGINDSHALAQADVSIAMGKGSDIAMDVAKMTLITSDLKSIPAAFRLSRKTVNAIRQNLFWAFIYNIIGIPIAAGLLYPVNGFLLDPMIAGAAMALSSVSVVLNSLRLKWSGL